MNEIQTYYIRVVNVTWPTSISFKAIIECALQNVDGSFQVKLQFITFLKFHLAYAVPTDIRKINWLQGLNSI